MTLEQNFATAYFTVFFVFEIGAAGLVLTDYIDVRLGRFKTKHDYLKTFALRVVSKLALLLALVSGGFWL